MGNVGSGQSTPGQTSCGHDLRPECVILTIIPYVLYYLKSCWVLGIFQILGTEIGASGNCLLVCGRFVKWP